MHRAQRKTGQDSPEANKGKRDTAKGQRSQVNDSTDVKIEDSGIKPSSKESMCEGQSRLVRLIESKYLISQMRFYMFPGHDVSEDESSCRSLKSLKNAGNYNLHHQNRQKKTDDDKTKIGQLDLTKLLKRRALALNSDRDNRLTRLEIENNCPTSRNKKNQATTEKKSIQPKSKEKSSKNEFLKVFLKRVNLSKDREVKIPKPKKQQVVSFKLKPPCSPPIKELSSLTKAKPADTITGRLSAKVLQPAQDSSRRNQLLRYLKDCQNSVEKINAQVQKNKTHRQGLSSGFPTSKFKLKDKAAFSSLVIEQPANFSKTKLMPNKPLKKTKSNSSSVKKRPNRESKKNLTYVEPNFKSTKSFRREHSFKDSSRRTEMSNNLPSKGELKPHFKSRQPSQKVFGSNFAGITKLVINTHRAYLHFDDKPLSDRRPDPK